MSTLVCLAECRHGTFHRTRISGTFLRSRGHQRAKCIAGSHRVGHCRIRGSGNPAVRVEEVHTRLPRFRPRVFQAKLEMGRTWSVSHQESGCEGIVADDPTANRAEYDESICTAFCPECGCALLPDAEGPMWCPGCENHVDDREIKSEPRNHKLCRWCGGPIDMEWYRASALEGRPSDQLCRGCFEEDD